MNKVIKEYSLSWKDMMYIVVGSFILALSFQVFLLPNEIISGGVSGITIILNDLFGWEPAYIQYAFNVPLLILSFVLLGKEVFFKSILGSLLFPFFVDLVSGLEAWTLNSMLAALFGGVATGIGVGLVYKSKGSTGGTSTLAQIIEKYTRVTMGEAVSLTDGFVLALGFITFDIETIMYGMISLVVVSRFVDYVLIGNRTQKMVLIISNESENIRQEILEKIDRGVTRLEIRGGYQNEEKEMLMAVIQENEFTALQEMVLQIDESAFIVVTSASEVMGRGFSLEKYFSSNQAQ